MGYRELLKNHHGLFMDYHGVRWATMDSSQTTIDYHALPWTVHGLPLIVVRGLPCTVHGLPWTTMGYHELP